MVEFRIVPLFGILLLNIAGLATAPASEGLTIRIGAEDSKNARVTVGDLVVVKLPVQLGTGYSWTITRLPKNVLLVGKSLETPGAIQPGGMEYEVFKMKIEKPISEYVLFSLVQPFEIEQKPVRTVRLNLTVSVS